GSSKGTEKRRAQTSPAPWLGTTSGLVLCRRGDSPVIAVDTTTANNINADGTTISTSDAGKAHWLLGFNGLLHVPLVDNTDQANDHGAAVSDDMFNEVRGKLGKYGVRPSELAYITDINTY